MMNEKSTKWELLEIDMAELDTLEIEFLGRASCFQTK